MTAAPFPKINISQWPERDRLLWEVAQEPADLFDDSAHLASTWSQATISSCEKGYSLWLGWLSATGQLDQAFEPCSRLTKDRITAFIEAYGTSRSELTVAGTLRNIAYVLRACSPPKGVAWFTKYAHRAVNNARPSRPKLSRMARIKDLVCLSEQLMTEGLRDITQGRRSGAQKYRDGLLIGFLSARPLRRCNLAGLRLGHTLLVGSNGTLIDIPGTETKNARPVRAMLPLHLVEPLNIYLTQARPILLGKTSHDDGWLWISRQGHKMPANDITIRVSKTTMQRLGRPVSPHLFRDCVATEVAIEDPAHVGINKNLLGHASLATSQKYYNQATSFSAFAQYQEVLRKLRRKSDCN